MTFIAFQLSLEVTDLIRERYSQDSYYGDESEWTKISRIEARVVCFWRLDRLCVQRNSKLQLKLIFEMRDNSSACP
jgi:hypothetical protein